MIRIAFRLTVLPLTLCGLFVACASGIVQSAEPFQRTEDKVYGRKFGLALTMDVFQPPEPNGCGLLFLVNGGWLSSKDTPQRVTIRPDVYQVYLERGYTVFAVVTSSQPKFIISEQIEDVERAVRFVRANAAKYGVRPNRLGVMGASSGGHLTLSVATRGGPGNAESADPVERESSAVQAVACFFPPTDFLNYGGPGICGLGEGPLAQLKVAFGPQALTAEGRESLGREISPIYYVTAQLPPTLIIHGDADQGVPIQQSESFVRRAQEAGAPHIKLIVRPGKGHGWGDFWKSTEDVTAFADWFDAHLRDRTEAGVSWPQFRGPSGQGLSDEVGLPITWGGEDREHVLWQSPLVGEGHASPIVWSNRAFVSTARWPDDSADKAQVVPEHHLLCYDTADGRLIWDTKIPPGPWKRNDFRSGAGGGYAAPTPATDGQLVFCAFGSSVLAAVDFAGMIVWRKEVVPHTFDVTLGSSPVLYGNTVILLHAMANKADSRVVAYRKLDGEIDWQQPLSTTGFGHSTPLVIQAGGRSQLLVLASGMSTSTDALQSLDPTNGRRLWWCRGGGDASSPAYGGGIVYFDNGRGGPGVAVDPSGEGDVSGTHVRWTIDQVPEAIGSPIIVGDLVYRLHSPGVLRCWQASDGKQLYVQRLDGISSTWVSPVADGENHIFFANAGKSFVIEAGREYKLLATNELGDPNHASPALAAGRMLLVGTKNVYCIGKTKEN